VVITAKGPVEYAVAGRGPAVLILHGGVGGWDQAVGLATSLFAPPGTQARFETDVATANAIVGDRFSLVAPSRVGYLKTPLSTGRSPQEGADAMAALLDVLQLERVIVVGVSGGGPTALQFAIRHPGRTAALVMVAAISKRHVQPAQTTENIVARVVFIRGMGWFVDLIVALALTFIALFPMLAANKLLEATETWDATGLQQRLTELRSNPAFLKWLRSLVSSIYPLSARSAGLANDLAQFAQIEEYAVKQIQCPTLVVHGRPDGNVPFDHADFVACAVPGCELVVAESCGHFLWTSSEERMIRERVDRFLRSHVSTATSFGVSTNEIWKGNCP